MSQTRDGVTYQRGMTLYSIVPNLGGPFVSAHPDTYEPSPRRWQTNGSPGAAGYVPDCFSSERAAIEEIIRRFDFEIERVKKAQKPWKAKLKEI